MTATAPVAARPVTAIEEQELLHSFLYTAYLLLNLIYFAMPLQDRTNEFLSCVDSIRNRSSLPTKVPSKQRRGNKSEFTRMASVIGKDISTTTVKLGKLAQREHVYRFIRSRCTKHAWLTVAKRKTLFDDRPVEISVRVPLAVHLFHQTLKKYFLGAHFRHQTRHCKYQQADCNAPGGR